MTGTGNDAEFLAITSDIKRSVEYVIKKHLRANPGLQINSGDVEHMLFGSQLDSPSREGAESYLLSGTAAPQNSAVQPSAARRLSDDRSMMRRLSDDSSYTLHPIQENRAHQGEYHPHSSAASVASLSSVAAGAPGGGNTVTPGFASASQSLPTITEPSRSSAAAVTLNRKPSKSDSSISPATPTTTVSGMVKEPSIRNGVLSSIGNLFGAMSGKNNTSSQQRGMHKQISSLGPIADVEEGEGSLREVNDQDHTRQDEIHQLEDELQQANEQWAILNAQKSKVKKELKEWQKSFQARVGRPPTDADKSAIEDRFQFYQKITSNVREAAEIAQQIESQLNSLINAQ
mmetsp:Transcript_15683/g.31676  ORF Transcript_15683/g.31676 Transcript_15683/m.31676 type:complete len:345 (-) Transcript_15683:3-1037(-)